MLFEILRKMRHGPLKRLAAFWYPLGRAWRYLMGTIGRRVTATQYISSYGPFKMDGYFAFSDFSHWGRAHNDCFASCIEACRGKRCILDIGAHIGLVTLPAASVVADGGIVIAFEPSLANRQFLMRHIGLNDVGGFVRVEPLVVGADTRETIPFFESHVAAGKNTAVRAQAAPDMHRTLRPQTSVDDYCRKNGLRPDVIKIDVEGSELEVLEGARATLAQFRPVVFLSVHPRLIKSLGHELDDLARIIDSAGYECNHADGSAVTSFALREYVLTPRSTRS